MFIAGCNVLPLIAFRPPTVSGRPILEYHAGHRQCGGMGKRECRVRHTQAGSDLCCAPVKAECRPTSRFPGYFDFEPIHAPADARSQSLCARFFGRESRCQTLCRLPLAQAVCLLRCRVDAVEKPLSKTLHGLLDATNLYQINSAAHDHSVYQATSFTRGQLRREGAPIQITNARGSLLSGVSLSQSGALSFSPDTAIMFRLVFPISRA